MNFIRNCFDDLHFEVDKEGGNIDGGSSRLFYLTNGNIDDFTEDGISKPSQERPAILKQKAKRYHEIPTNTKYTPGKMSYQLRKALGLTMTDVPEHIYRMRHLGYPPGWLKKAEVKKDNISITGANTVVNTSRNTSVKYDWEKLYEFPGFNTYKNYNKKYDRCHELGFMPIQENTLLENFLTFLSEQRMLGKEATNMKDIRSRMFINAETDFNLPITPSMKPTASSTPIQLGKRKRTRSIDLSDGEVEDEDITSESCIDSSEKQEDSINNNSGSKELKTENGTILIVPLTSKPSLDRFSEGINDHRLFENLPNVGGTYKKVLDVLKRIQA